MLGLFDRPASESEIDALRAPPTIKGLTDSLEGLAPSAWNEALTTLRDMGLLVEAPLGGSAEELDAHPSSASISARRCGRFTLRRGARGTGGSTSTSRRRQSLFRRPSKR